MAYTTRVNRPQPFKGLTFWGQWSIASIISLALFLGVAYYHEGSVAYYYRAGAILSVLGSLPAYSLFQVYAKQDTYLTGMTRLLGGWLLTLAVLTAIGFLCNADELFSRQVVFEWAVLGYVAQMLAYLPLQWISKHYHRQLQRQQRTLIIGTGELALGLAQTLERLEQFPLVGLVSADNSLPEHAALPPVLGPLEDLRQLIEAHAIRRLYITLPLSEASHIEAMYGELLDANVDVVWVPDLKSLTLLNHSVRVVNGLPAIYLNESPLTSQPTAALSKSLLEKSVALLAIVVLAPALLLIALAVKSTSPGPVFFKQARHGWNGKIIQVWKFRSMRVHDDTHVVQASRTDSRITPVGRFIRRTSLDELPQLFNVLQGRMALVGPRPHAVAHNNFYADKILAYMARHRIKPGLTGLAQINGCRGETETLDKMQKRVEIDLAYINNWSLWLDVKILFKTPFTLLSKDIY